MVVEYCQKIQQNFNFQTVVKFSYIFRSQHSSNNYMRRRSGGLHSTSEEEYIELADVAQKCSSLFYDEPKPTSSSKRRKYAFSLQSGKEQSAKEIKKQVKIPKINKAFQSFDFDQQSYNFSKDCEQLKNVEQQIKNQTKKSHYAILSSKEVDNTLQLVNSVLGISNQVPKGPSRIINLCVHKYTNPESKQIFIDCYWVIDASQSVTYESLFNVYIQKSVRVLDLRPLDACSQITSKAIKSMVDEIHESRLKTAKDQI